MKLLVDNPLSPLVATLLCDAGYDAVHVRDFQMQAATDEKIFEFAAEEGRVVVSADTDFGTLLALRREKEPSFVLLRGATPRKPADQAAMLIANLPSVASDLAAGAVVVFEPGRLRVRSLPISE